MPGSHESATNSRVASRLQEFADLLRAKETDPFRAAAYRRAAEAIRTYPRDVDDILSQEGRKGLRKLPGVGDTIAGAVEEIVQSGRWSALDQLQKSATPKELFQAVAGLGPELAQAIHDTLHLSTLEELETAAHDGRLELVPGIGARRAATVRGALQELLGRVRVGRQADRPPHVADILAVDEEYRREAAAGRLLTISPKRFNPDRTSWLPVYEVDRAGWRFTALYSNTALAHRLDKTRDWVVITFRNTQREEGQNTVVSGKKGFFAGKRVVRGRERECREFYSEQGS